VIFVVSGPGGVGKGTVVGRLLELEPGLRLSRSWTTRSRRPGEREDAYFFTDRDSFMAAVEAGRFLEWTEFPGTGHLYGTPLPDSDDPRDLLLEIELDGAQQVKRQRPEAVLVLVVAPSPEVQEERLRGRGDDEGSVRRRLEVGAAELELGRRIADHVVVNDDVDRAAKELAGIIESCRLAGTS
jgi:guanylate kinase